MHTSLKGEASKNVGLYEQCVVSMSLLFTYFAPIIFSRFMSNTKEGCLDVPAFFLARMNSANFPRRSANFPSYKILGKYAWEVPQIFHTKIKGLLVKEPCSKLQRKGAVQ